MTSKSRPISRREKILQLNEQTMMPERVEYPIGEHRIMGRGRRGRRRRGRRRRLARGFELVADGRIGRVEEMHTERPKDARTVVDDVGSSETRAVQQAVDDVAAKHGERAAALRHCAEEGRRALEHERLERDL